MNRDSSAYVPALGYGFLTRLYDPVLALTTRERTFKQRLIHQALITPGAAVLDVGCGSGTLALWIKQAQPLARVTGLDGDPAILAIARRKTERAGVDVQFDSGFSYDMPYADGSFDRILSSLAFHHLTHDAKRQTIAEILRVLKPAGELHIADWGRPSSAWRRGLFYPVQWLDGFATTRDSVEGRLPQMLADGGFTHVREREVVETIYGTLGLYSAQRSKCGTQGDSL